MCLILVVSLLLNLIVPFRAPSSKTQVELTVVSFLQFCIVFKILSDPSGPAALSRSVAPVERFAIITYHPSIVNTFFQSFLSFFASFFKRRTRVSKQFCNVRISTQCAHHSPSFCIGMFGNTLFLIPVNFVFFRKKMPFFCPIGSIFQFSDHFFSITFSKSFSDFRDFECHDPLNPDADFVLTD